MLEWFAVRGPWVSYTSSSSFKPQHDIWRLILGGVAAGEVSHEGRPLLLLALRERRFYCLHVLCVGSRSRDEGCLILENVRNLSGFESSFVWTLVPRSPIELVPALAS